MDPDMDEASAALIQSLLMDDMQANDDESDAESSNSDGYSATDLDHAMIFDDDDLYGGDDEPGPVTIGPVESSLELDSGEYGDQVAESHVWDENDGDTIMENEIFGDDENSGGNDNDADTNMQNDDEHENGANTNVERGEDIEYSASGILQSTNNNDTDAVMTDAKEEEHHQGSHSPSGSSASNVSNLSDVLAAFPRPANNPRRASESNVDIAFRTLYSSVGVENNNSSGPSNNMFRPTLPAGSNFGVSSASSEMIPSIPVQVLPSSEATNDLGNSNRPGPLRRRPNFYIPDPQEGQLGVMFPPMEQPADTTANNNPLPPLPPPGPDTFRTSHPPGPQDLPGGLATFYTSNPTGPRDEELQIPRAPRVLPVDSHMALRNSGRGRSLTRGGRGLPTPPSIPAAEDNDDEEADAAESSKKAMSRHERILARIEENNSRLPPEDRLDTSSLVRPGLHSTAADRRRHGVYFTQAIDFAAGAGADANAALLQQQQQQTPGRPRPHHPGHPNRRGVKRSRVPGIDEEKSIEQELRAIHNRAVRAQDINATTAHHLSASNRSEYVQHLLRQRKLEKEQEAKAEKLANYAPYGRKKDVPSGAPNQLKYQAMPVERTIVDPETGELLSEWVYVTQITESPTREELEGLGYEEREMFKEELADERQLLLEMEEHDRTCVVRIGLPGERAHHIRQAGITVVDENTDVVDIHVEEDEDLWSVVGESLDIEEMVRMRH